jgi:hypothetical protein
MKWRAWAQKGFDGEVVTFENDSHQAVQQWFRSMRSRGYRGSVQWWNDGESLWIG